MNKSKTILLLILILLATNAFWAVIYFSLFNELHQTKIDLETQITNEKVLEFTKLFIEKVLKAETEVDFETRLKLENAVRNLGDEEIFNQWQRFIESEAEAEAQDNVKNLLEILVNKIKTQ